MLCFWVGLFKLEKDRDINPLAQSLVVSILVRTLAKFLARDATSSRKYTDVGRCKALFGTLSERYATF